MTVNPPPDGAGANSKRSLISGLIRVAREIGPAIGQKLRENVIAQIVASLMLVGGGAYVFFKDSVILPAAYNFLHPELRRVDPAAYAVVLADISGDGVWSRQQTSRIFDLLKDEFDRFQGASDVQLQRTWREVRTAQTGNGIGEHTRDARRVHEHLAFDALLWGVVRGPELHLHLAQVNSDGTISVSNQLEDVTSKTALAEFVAPVIAALVAQQVENVSADGDSASRTITDGALNRLLAHIPVVMNDRSLQPSDRGAVLSAYAIAIREMGEQRRDPAIVERSVIISRQALGLLGQHSGDEIRQWGMAQNALGNSLSSLAELRDDDALLVQSIEAFHAAEGAFDRVHDQDRLAAAKMNRGISLGVGGQIHSDTVMLQQSADLFREAAGVFETTGNRVDLARAQHNLGNALTEIGRIQSDRSTLQEAVQSYGRALAVSDAQTPRAAAVTRADLGETLLELNRVEPAPGYGQGAAGAFQQGLQAAPSDDLALQARLNTGLAESQQIVGDNNHDPVAYCTGVRAQQAALTTNRGLIVNASPEARASLRRDVRAGEQRLRALQHHLQSFECPAQ